MRMSYSELKKKISGIIPKNIDYEIDLEAGSISIITKQPEKFVTSTDNLTVKIAKLVKRRIVIRPHPDILSSEQEVHDAVGQIIPHDAQVRKVWLDPALSEVILECDNPSDAVGPKGSNIQALRDKIGWLVKVVRAPSIESRTQHDIRRYRKEMSEERKSLLRKFGARIYRPQGRVNLGLGLPP